MTATPVSQIFKFLGLCSLAAMGVAARADIIPFESNGRVVEVDYRDLDLGKKADQQELNARIRRAAVKVCPARTVQESRSCQLTAIDHIREPIAAAIARAQSDSRYAVASAKGAPQAGN